MVAKGLWMQDVRGPCWELRPEKDKGCRDEICYSYINLPPLLLLLLHTPQAHVTGPVSIRTLLPGKLFARKFKRYVCHTHGNL
jgi:hypothetical protein